MGRDVARTQQRREPGGWIALGVLGMAIVVVVAAWLCLKVGSSLAGDDQEVPGNPAVALIYLAIVSVLSLVQSLLEKKVSAHVRSS